MSRDASEEDGGIPLYGFVRNAPSFLLDVLGLLRQQSSSWPTKVGEREVSYESMPLDGGGGFTIVEGAPYSPDHGSCEGKPLGKRHAKGDALKQHATVAK